MSPARLARWIAGFEESHGHASFSVVDGALDLLGMDGSTARCTPLVPFAATSGELPGSFVEHALPDRTVVLLLLRRGGYGVGVLQGGALTASKVGTRYVQSRTAAGGWSQHRFARRRDNQAAGLIDTAAATAVRVVLGEDGREPPAGALLVTGGDRVMVDRLLEDRRLAQLSALPRPRHLDVPDPRDDVLRQAAHRAVAVQIQVHNA
ncbi:acVLRF1 family peptidyl-tRNA hydrolase [Angustibacter sp. McL0619]|uniref:acVLRF1 family peptidyl-tRNA hydrolase n=1 Tax=Angustibacter sp. McL0619 TaxID=3415676 RepID=UPI003CEB66EF